MFSPSQPRRLGGDACLCIRLARSVLSFHNKLVVMRNFRTSFPKLLVTLMFSIWFCRIPPESSFGPSNTTGTETDSMIFAKCCSPPGGRVKDSSVGESAGYRTTSCRYEDTVSYSDHLGKSVMAETFLRSGTLGQCKAVRQMQLSRLKCTHKYIVQYSLVLNHIPNSPFRR